MAQSQRALFQCSEQREKDDLEMTELRRDLSISQREQERISRELHDTTDMYQVSQVRTELRL